MVAFDHQHRAAPAIPDRFREVQMGALHTHIPGEQDRVDPVNVFGVGDIELTKLGVEVAPKEKSCHAYLQMERWCRRQLLNCL